jgi:hypothetical protein
MHNRMHLPNIKIAFLTLVLIHFEVFGDAYCDTDKASNNIPSEERIFVLRHIFRLASLVMQLTRRIAHGTSDHTACQLTSFTSFYNYY